MPINTVIFQAMNDDYIENIPMQHLLATIRHPERRMNSSEVYYCTTFLNEVSTDAQTAYLMYKHGVGYFLSIHELSEEGMVNYIASGSTDLPDVIRIQTARFQFAIPRSFFLPIDAAIDALQYFCETGRRHPVQRWIRYDDLGFELYSDD